MLTHDDPEAVVKPLLWHFLEIQVATLLHQIFIVRRVADEFRREGTQELMVFQTSKPLDPGKFALGLHFFDRLGFRNYVLLSSVIWLYHLWALARRSFLGRWHFHNFKCIVVLIIVLIKIFFILFPIRVVLLVKLLLVVLPVQLDALRAVLQIVLRGGRRHHHLLLLLHLELIP